MTTERGDNRESKTRKAGWWSSRRTVEKLRELEELQQQNGIAAQSRENAMAWYDTAFDRLTTVAAFPLGFLMGDVMDFKTPTAEEKPNIEIYANQINVNEPAQTQSAPVQEVAAQEQKPEMVQATEQTAADQALAEEKRAWEEAYQHQLTQKQEQGLSY